MTAQGRPGVFGATLADDDSHTALVESLRYAVPLAILELHAQHPDGVPGWKLRQDAARIGTYGDYLTVIDGRRGMSRAPKRTASQLDSFALAHNAFVRGLAALTLMTPGGVTFAGLHWCTVPHPDCPTPPRELRPPVSAEDIARVVALGDELEAMMSAAQPPSRENHATRHRAEAAPAGDVP